eukprot:TRINITY_DN8574_c0_g1_i2.p1 TRINITY_DN8574_c0_g1~~TRINITY_DN8574_c0_g1_i2.p1  ORF type:complete len:164 (+),score=29.20 TRINITY_DN8574_c0_g1_i2:60-494(+)
MCIRDSLRSLRISVEEGTNVRVSSLALSPFTESLVAVLAEYNVNTETRGGLWVFNVLSGQVVRRALYRSRDSFVVNWVDQRRLLLLNLGTRDLYLYDLEANVSFNLWSLHKKPLEALNRRVNRKRLFSLKEEGRIDFVELAFSP